MRIAIAWAGAITQEGQGGSVGQDPNMVSMRERVRVVKVDLDHPEKEPEIIEQETITPISLTDAALLGFTPGQGFDPIPAYQDTYSSADANHAWAEFSRDSDGPIPPVEGVRVGDE